MQPLPVDVSPFTVVMSPLTYVIINFLSALLCAYLSYSAYKNKQRNHVFYTYAFGASVYILCFAVNMTYYLSKGN